MTSTNPAHAHGKRRLPVAKILSVLILCLLCPPAVHAHKTDAELAQALIGTWELPRTEIFSKRFVTFNADGTSKAIRIINDRGYSRRAENEGTWRVNDVYLIREVTKTTHDLGTPFKVRVQIESIENGTAKLRDEKGGDEMRRVGQLPRLPPVVTSTWAPELSVAETKKITISSPQPDYPIDARRSRIQGSGMFRLNLAKDGKVASIQVLKSTGSKTLDDAAERALRQWRFKPSTILEAVSVPINFVLSRGHINKQ